MSAVERMTAKDLGADENWWRIYEDSFPASERESPEVILESVLGKVGMAFRLRRQGMTYGLATTHLLNDPAAVFLVYLAVAREERSRGAGAELLQGAWESGATRLRAQGRRPLGLIWEVDPLESAADDAEARQRRIAFFRRNGGELLDRPYLQPPLNGGTAIPMSLMFRAAESEQAPAAETVEAFVRAIYFEKYGAVNRIDISILKDLMKRG